MYQAEKENLELEAILADLEKEVIERTCELQSAMQNADQACLANSDFFTRMSDELRSPMNIVIDMVQLMLVTGMEPAQRKLIEAISQSGISLLETVDSAQHSSKYPGEIVPLIDVDYASKMKNDFSEGVFASLVQQYCSDVEQTLCDLEHATQSHDPERISSLLHLLKGCSANFGASAIVGLCDDFSAVLKRLEDITQSDITQMKQVYCGTKTQLLKLAGNLPHA